MTNSHKPGNVILLTKLNRPGVTKDLVVRPRLLNLLDSGIEGPLTLVVAPAGFGKTTLVSSWMQTLGDDKREDRQPVPAAWLSLDERDGDRDVFVRHFIAALRTIFPDACPQTRSLLNARRQPPSSLMRDMLSNELEYLPSRFVIVLDDLNNLHNEVVFDCLTDWMRHWPRTMHLVVLSRFNPPLPLAALRARGQLTEIRSRDLRFSSLEAAEYYRRTLMTSPDENTLATLQQLLEGWIAGLKMATLSLRDRHDPQALTSGLLDGVYIADYLLEEVLNRQSPAMQRFLLRSSIAEQFCVSLCEALMDSQETDCDVRACLDELEAADLFLTSLDTRREWYRFHQMFREMLRQRLLSVIRPDQVNELHRRAARWFAEHDLIEQAISHALEAGRLDLVVQFMQQGLPDVLNQEDRPTLERWLSLLPEDFVRQSPELLMMRAWGHALRWEVKQMAAGIERAEALLEGSNGTERAGLLRGQIAVLKGSSCFSNHQYEGVVTHCGEGLALLPEEWRYARGIGAVYMGMSLYASGRAGDSEKFLSEHYESARDKTDGYALRLLLGLTINFIQAGNYENAERTARAMLRQAVEGRLAVIEGWAHAMIGLVNYEWNELQTAASHFAAVVALFHMTQWATARNGMIGQALTYQAMGRSADALEPIDRLSRIDIDFHGQEGMDTAAARARLMLMRGDTEGAERWADLDADRSADQSLLPWMEQPALTRARILIARNKGADVRSALQILDVTGELAERTFNTRIMVEVLALRALAQLAQGDSPGARQSLIRSVELSRPGMLTRIYLDIGPQMQKLLLQIAGHKPIVKTVSRLLAAFPDATSAADFSTNGKTVRQSPSPSDSSDEHLTARELDVLSLMAEPISLKIIATRLNISYATTRRYTINIYDKFGVHSRWEAVDLAIRKGIIPPR